MESISAALSLDQLLAKYDIAGPRYTSYPTAPHFSPVWDRETLREDFLRDNRPGSSPISLYFHLPFCERKCWFCGCTTVITKDGSVADAYLDDLEAVMDLVAQHIDPERSVVQIHFGGGTPTFFSPAQLARLGRTIQKRFRISSHVEFSVEIDPRHATDDHIAVLREIGCNRASLGVQDFNAKVQQAVNRIQPRELTVSALARLRARGFQSVNLDLIYGLPEQTPNSFIETLLDVISLRPDRLAIFSYAHVPAIKPAQRIFDHRGNLPSVASKLRMQTLAVERLIWAGYACIGMDHFALETDELVHAQRRGTLQRNFQGYTTHGGTSLYAFGMSSISQTAGAYRQNFKDIAQYRAAVRSGKLPIERVKVLAPDDLRRAYVIQRIMCDNELRYSKLSAHLELSFEEHFKNELESLEPYFRDGLIEKHEDGFTTTPFGRLLVRVIAMKFDRYLTSGRATYSKVI
jgi:oxygen-independent coproporphyrinogen-3 oxidase